MLNSELASYHLDVYETDEDLCGQNYCLLLLCDCSVNQVSAYVYRSMSLHNIVMEGIINLWRACAAGLQ